MLFVKEIGLQLAHVTLELGGHVWKKGQTGDSLGMVKEVGFKILFGAGVVTLQPTG